MKTQILFLVMLLTMTLTVKAQFNTISKRPSLYSVATTPEESSETTPETTTEETTETTANDTIDSRQQWIDQYMSVSYPLKDIHISSPFGKRKDPFTGKNAKHNGVDLRANHQDIYAVMMGIVDKVGFDKRSGNFIKVNHGDYTVSYCHLSKIEVKKGQLVRPGDVLGISGNTGRSTGPHLHFVLKQGRKTLNPCILFDYIKQVREEALRNLVSIT